MGLPNTGKSKFKDPKLHRPRESAEEQVGRRGRSRLRQKGRQRSERRGGDASARGRISEGPIRRIGPSGVYSECDGSH